MSESSRSIPRQFHFVFGLKPQREQFHLTYYLCLRSCLELNRPRRMFFYYHYLPYGHYWELIRPHLILVRVPRHFGLAGRYESGSANRRYSYAHHADFIRVQQLLARGGVYADMDTLFINPLPDHLFDCEVVMGREADVLCEHTGVYRPSLCNAFIMGRAGAPFLAQWLRLMPTYFDGTWSNHSCYLPFELSERHPQWVHVEPARSFFPYMWSREDLTVLFEGRREEHADVYSIHLWNHLWWGRWRRDFTAFHHGLITEDRIRRLDTTFNLLARPFLPTRSRSWSTALRDGVRDAWGGLLGLPQAGLWGLNVARQRLGRVGPT